MNKSTKFDLNLHAIEEMTIAEAILRMERTKSETFRQRLRGILILAKGALAMHLTKFKRSKLCREAENFASTCESIRREIKLIDDALEHRQGRQQGV